MYTEEDLLPISALQHLLFCKRRAALVHLEGLWAENLYTAEGNIVHGRVDLDGFETRRDRRYATGLRIRSLRLGLIGRADLVEFNRMAGSDQEGIKIEGLPGAWLPCPVEYKRGEARTEEEFEVQLCAQAFCLEEMWCITINRGSIYYAASKHRVEVEFNADLRLKTEAAAVALRQLFESQVTPLAEYHKKCSFCSVNEVCMPILAKRQSAQNYLEKLMETMGEVNEKD